VEREEEALSPVLEETRGKQSRPSRRRSVRTWIRSHLAWVVVAGTILLALVVFALVWFQPQKLVLDQRVNEALPGMPAGSTETTGPASPVATTPPAAGAPSPQALVTLASGEFRSLEHHTTGRALILERADGTRYLRFEDLETSNGPDLHVYLSEIPAGDDWYAYGERFVDLGKLKGNIGDQNYSIPANVDLSAYRSAVIWCKRFSVGFAVAPLEG
jgi:hypothetical protein